MAYRIKARTFADKTIAQQKDTFRSWGVIGDWDHHYETKHVSYIENQLKQFLKLYENGYIFRDVKPIYWSPSSRTALAEAELEYNEKHKSPSVYARVLIKDIPQVPQFNGKKIYGIFWTTTPWTLPSNQAVCYNNSLSYCIIKKPEEEEKDLYIIAADLLEAFCSTVNCNYQLLGVHSGDMLKDATYFHPIYKEQVCKFLHSSHATNAKGTGLVHAAPAHGPDDFLVGMLHKMKIVDVVSDEGLYKSEAGEPFAGKYVLTEGNETVIEYLRDDLIHKSDLTHSYPYDWRTKKPVIIKASKQWFIDTDRIKDRAAQLLDTVKIQPQIRSEMYRKVMINQLQKRPYWCISRQRKWGVPIPVFYHHQTKEPLINQNIIDHLCAKLQENGSDFWWQLPQNQLLPPEYSDKAKDYIKGEDILDIWFDSGISWSYLFNDSQVADLYLEGVDQFTGWFQSSLITSTALRDRCPFKEILVHGFAVDEKGEKMSKSLGNVVDPVDVVLGGKAGQNAYGVDVLRWWVACHANQTTMASVSTNILNQSKDEVQKIRSILRFAISALSDYQYDEEDFQHTRLVDRYILHLLYQIHGKIKSHIESHNFHQINFLLIPLLVNQISALYFTSIKDRLYCEPASSVSRRSAQYTLFQLYFALSEMVGGILPHLVEESYSYLPQKSDRTFFTSPRPLPRKLWTNTEIEKVMEVILNIRNAINQNSGEESALKLDIKVELAAPEYHTLQPYFAFNQDIMDILQVASIGICQNTSSDETIKVSASKSHKLNCPRCRLCRSNAENQLCPRCQIIVEDFDVNKNINIKNV
ncbi:isoleucine--tRNA ligase, mitochondrial isoform X2 [Dendroctonus ponderosae]|uniref:isoleucine--tRNA ligase n=1 Tax=Dendroctonus ponderosae TaxID=77166 RepID=A0AAR5PSY2_DENPD|nr:isoleucine--tRNA ligase, mitochondrial isoform X2 [Dendroctonus ponderosae]